MANAVEQRWECPNCSEEYAEEVIEVTSVRVWVCPVDAVTIETDPALDGMPPGWCAAEGDYFDKVSCATTYVTNAIAARA